MHASPPHRIAGPLALAILAATVLVPAARVGADHETTLRASVATTGTQGNEDSFDPHVSADGRLVVFESDASNLVPGDTNGRTDIFVRDLVAGTTIRVSVSSTGAQGNGPSGTDPIISADGRYVAFPSYASNLVPGDTNGTRDVFVRDIVGGTTTRVSVSSTGAQGNRASFDPYVSGDGRYVTFSSQASNLVAGDTNGNTDVFIRDTVAGTTTRVSVADDGGQADASSEDAVVSDDGRYVAFSSLAENLVRGGDTNDVRDIFVHDRSTSATRRASVSSTGAQGNGESGYNPAISGDGRFVAFNSTSSNLVPGDTNSKRDVFVWETATGAVTRVSVSSAGAQANGSSSSAPSLSRDGRYVAFLSGASNLVTGDTNGDRDVFLRDRLTGTTVRASVTADGGQSNGGDCFSQPYVAQAGSVVVFTCAATNLVPGDTNGAYDVFVRTLAALPQPEPDTTAPSVAVTAPSDGTTVSGVVRVVVDAADDTAVARVELLVGDRVVAAAMAAPWTFDWDTADLAEGTWELRARARDAAGNTATSEPVRVTVRHDTPPTEPPPTETVELTFTAAADSTVRNDRPSANYGAATIVGTDAEPVKQALLRFDVAGLGSRRVQRAVLRLHAVDSSGSGGTVHAVPGTWDERAVTWDSRPALGGTAGSFGAVSAGAWYDEDVTALVTGDGPVGLALVSASTNGADYASREHAGLAPQLVVVAGP